MKILVVDDSRLARASIIKTVNETSEEKHEIIQGVNGQEGVDLFKSESPVLVFLDLTMPVKDGFEALKEIKAYDEKAHVVVVSADVQAKAVAQVMHDGAIMHIKKPITNEKMKEIIKMVDFLSNIACRFHSKFPPISLLCFHLNHG